MSSHDLIYSPVQTKAPIVMPSHPFFKVEESTLPDQFPSMKDAEDDFFKYLDIVPLQHNLNYNDFFVNNPIPGLSVVDHYSTLIVLINRQANWILKRTLKEGNVCIVSQKAYDILCAARSAAFARATTPECFAASNLLHIGYLWSSIRVFVHPQWADDHRVIVTCDRTDKLKLWWNILSPNKCNYYLSDNWMEYFGFVNIVF